MLAKHGLKRAGPLFVLESEAEVHAKAEEVRQLSRQLRDAVAQQRTTFSEKEYQDTIKELTDEINQLRPRCNTATQMINRLPRGRRGISRQQHRCRGVAGAELPTRTQLQMEITQRTASLNQLKSKPFDPKVGSRRTTRCGPSRRPCTRRRRSCGSSWMRSTRNTRRWPRMPQVKKWLDTPEGPAGGQAEAGPVAGVPPRSEDAGADRARIWRLGRSRRPGRKDDAEGPPDEG